MAACDSLKHIFGNPLPENPSLIESLSQWNQIKSIKPIELLPFTEIFGELHFKDNHESPSSSSSSSSSQLHNPQTQIQNLDKNEELHNNGNANCNSNENKNKNPLPPSDFFLDTQKNQYVGSSPHNCEGFLLKNTESLQLCTEGLGSESTDDVEDSKNEGGDDWKREEKGKASLAKYSSIDNLCGDLRRSRKSRGDFPPPISSIGRSGKPWVCFKSYRHDGRFVLKEIKIPTKDLLHACREDGRLKLHFVQPEEEIFPEEEEDEEEEEEEEVDDVEVDGVGDETVVD